jgi:hypothetical protein
MHMVVAAIDALATPLIGREGLFLGDRKRASKRAVG